jgi:methylated-DNA-[protein]-cysteine S-methyltransferase
MSAKPTVCVQIEPDLVAAATGDATSGTVRRVEDHVVRCQPCRLEFERYRAVDRVVGALRSGPFPAAGVGRAREGLEARLADLRRRLMTYRIFPSPLGQLLIARSEVGVSLVEYLERGTSLRGSRLSRAAGVEVTQDGGELEALHRELLEYLDGRRTRLEWPLDLRLARSAFHRKVLQATAGVPYGAVIPYAGIAREVGKPSAVRAVAQALRWNPVPIVIPCHRVIGTSGALTGYAGAKIGLKQRLLALEGVPTARAAGEFRIMPRAMYVLYPGEREYCLPTCPSFGWHRPAPLTRFGSREHAEAAGLAPCTSCRPDLHPISR